MNNQNRIVSYGGAEALEARFGLKVAARLHEASRELPHDLSERLKAAREVALERARQARRMEAATAQAASAGPAAALVLGGGPRRHWWIRVAAMVPALALVGGFILIDHVRTTAQIKAAAEVDAALLADDAPPAAYSDPGFVEFLKTPRD